MKPKPRISTAERFGRWLGRGWRGYLRGERRMLEWLVAKDMPEWIAVVLMWAVKLAVLGVLLYVAFWVLLVFVVAAARVAKHSAEQEEDDFMNKKAEERDHRESLTYDPINYNDDPDPRFEEI